MIIQFRSFSLRIKWYDKIFSIIWKFQQKFPIWMPSYSKELIHRWISEDYLLDSWNKIYFKAHLGIAFWVFCSSRYKADPYNLVISIRPPHVLRIYLDEMYFMNHYKKIWKYMNILYLRRWMKNFNLPIWIFFKSKDLIRGS